MAGASTWVIVRRLAEAVQFSLDNETNYSAPGEDMAAFLLAGGMHGTPEPPGLRDGEAWKSPREEPQP